MADDAERIALVVDRALVPDLGDLDLRRIEPLGPHAEEVAVGARLAHVQLEAEEVAQAPRHWQRREQRDGGEIVHHLGVSRRPTCARSSAAAPPSMSGEHVGEDGIRVARRQVGEPSLARQQRTDVLRAAGRGEGRELHRAVSAREPDCAAWLRKWRSPISASICITSGCSAEAPANSR